jgi:putative ABC transport system permease protein
MINILGFSIGIAASVHIFNFCYNELNYDQFHTNKDRIFLVSTHVEESDWDDSGDLITRTPVPLLRSLVKEIPGVVSGFRLYYLPDKREDIIATEDKVYKIKQMIGADSEIFQILNIPLIYGNLDSIFHKPFSAVLSASLSRKLFGGENSVGQFFRDQQGNRYQVKGVIKDYPSTSHINFDVLYSLNSVSLYADTLNWVNHPFFTYIMVQDPAGVKNIEKKLPGFILDHIPVKDKLAPENQSLHYNYFLTPLKEIYLQNFFHKPAENKKRTIYILLALGFLILIVASFNYINLSMAMAVRRTKEITVRQIAGAKKKNLILQFLFESIMISILGLLLGMLLFEYSLPLINSILQQSYSVNYINHPLVIPALILLALLIGVISGLYPAMILSRSRPKQKFTSSIIDEKSIAFSKSRGFDIRDVLVVLQIAICMMIIIASLIIRHQIFYMEKRQLSIGVNNVLLLHFPQFLAENQQSFIDALLQNDNIQHFSVAGNLPLNINIEFETFLEHQSSHQTVMVHALISDENVHQTLGLDIITDKAHLEMLKTSEKAILVNESFVESFNLKNPVKQKIVGSPFVGINDEIFHIAGVFKDFHFDHLKEEIGEIVIYQGQAYENPPNYFLIDLKNPGDSNTLQFIREQWKLQTGNFPFYASSLKEEVRKLYGKEIRLRNLFTLFSVLSIFIASLGFLGLALFVLNSRRQEVAVRKALGASLTSIRIQLSKQFFVWLLVAAALAWPTAYFILNFWLSQFAYHIDPTPGVFIISFFIPATIVALIIIHWVIRISRINPAEILKTE